MLRRFRTSVVALAVVALLALPVAASAGTNVDKIGKRPAPLTVDVFFLRPMGFIGLVGSAGLWLPMAGVTAVTRPDQLGEVTDKMIGEPARFVFSDPLGSH